MLLKLSVLILGINKQKHYKQTETLNKMSKSIKKSNNTRYIIILVITLGLLFLSIILFNRYKLNNIINKNNKLQIESFYEDPTIKAVSSTVQPSPTSEALKPCSASPVDLAGMCKDYSNCCKTGSASKSCICNHPIVQQCQNEYNTCINDPNNINIYTPEQISEKCIAQNNGCCKSYDNINIDSSNFNEPIVQAQNNNVICYIPAIANINMTNKCMELCQTDPKCKAFSLTQNNMVVLGCNLFSSVSQPLIDPLGGDSLNKQQPNYYVKK